MPNEDDPYIPPPSTEILQKQWTTSHLDTALGRIPPPPEPPPPPPED
jgi:hypothetical protein